MKRLFIVLLFLFQMSCFSQKRDAVPDGKYLQFTFPSNDCENVKIDGIYILGFDSSALDTVKIRRFVKHSKFTQVIDSFYKCNIYQHRYIMDSVWKISYINTDSFLSSEPDFEIIICDTLVYRFSDVLVGRVKHGHGKYVCDIIAKKLNDIELGYGNFKIEKPGWDEEATIIGKAYFKWEKEYGEEWAGYRKAIAEQERKQKKKEERKQKRRRRD